MVMRLEQYLQALTYTLLTRFNAQHHKLARSDSLAQSQEPKALTGVTPKQNKAIIIIKKRMVGLGSFNDVYVNIVFFLVYKW